MALSQAVAFGGPETIQTVWDRMDEEERVSDPALIRLAIDFHRVEVARWLRQEQPLWLVTGRVFARETRAFDALSRLPGGDKAPPELGHVVRVDPNPKMDVPVAKTVEMKATNWLATALFAGGNPNANVACDRDPSPVFCCVVVTSGYEDCVRTLLQFGADPNQLWWNGSSVLAAAANNEVSGERGAAGRQGREPQRDQMKVSITTRSSAR
jgi:hypothetical protein